VRDGRLRTNIGNVATLDDAVAALNPTKRTTERRSSASAPENAHRAPVRLSDGFAVNSGAAYASASTLTAADPALTPVPGPTLTCPPALPISGAVSAATTRLLPPAPLTVGRFRRCRNSWGRRTVSPGACTVVPVPGKETCMARQPLRPVVKLRSTAGTGYTYVTRKSRRNDPDRISLRKYDPVVRQHTEFREER